MPGRSGHSASAFSLVRLASPNPLIHPLYSASPNFARCAHAHTIFAQLPHSYPLVARDVAPAAVHMSLHFDACALSLENPQRKTFHPLLSACPSPSPPLLPDFFIPPLLTPIKQNWYELMLFALATGLRQANVVRLEWGQVDLARNLAWIHPDQAKARRAIAVPLNLRHTWASWLAMKGATLAELQELGG